MAQFAEHAQDTGLKPQRQFDDVRVVVEVPRKIPLRRMLDGLSATVKENQVNQVPTGVLVWDAGSSTAPDTMGPSLCAGLEASADGRLWERVARDQSSIRSKSAGSIVQSFYHYEDAERALLLLLADHIGQVRS